jgi:tRNA A37 threonylcarbamoyladenosine dehydratase
MAAHVSRDAEAMEAILREQLARIEAMYGAEGMARIRGAFVVVVGLGGGAASCPCLRTLLLVPSLFRC